MLEIKNIVTHYGSALALDHVSLHVPDKGLTAIIGPNGAGKTTLLRAISRLIKLTEGDIIFNGESLLKMPAHKLAKIGIAHCPEGRKPFRGMTVKENLLIGGYAGTSAVLKKQLDLVYGLFPILKNRSGQEAATLSGGEQQMMAIGRALMMDPKLLLIDEPSLGLSPALVDEVEKIMKSIKNANVPVLMVEGNMDMITDLADLVYVFNHGNTTFSGTVADIRNDPNLSKTYIGM
jgi:branched-chain amino acid transport system ATP-binding protein